MAVTKQHIAGPLIDQVQRCVRCDEILADYRNTGMAVDPDVPVSSPTLGWECGKTVYELEGGAWSAYAPSTAWWKSCLTESVRP